MLLPRLFKTTNFRQASKTPFPLQKYRLAPFPSAGERKVICMDEKDIAHSEVRDKLCKDMEGEQVKHLFYC